MSPRVAKAVGWFARVLRSPWTLLLGVLMLGSSALLGNYFQNADRSSLKDDLGAARTQVDSLQAQLDRVKGEQECRSQIASESELYSGQLSVALGQFVVAAREGDRRSIDVAVAAISSASALLEPALEARQNAVETCAGNTAPTSEPRLPDATTSTTTLAPSTRNRITSPTTTPKPPTTTSTIYRTPQTTEPDCIDVLAIVCLPVDEVLP